MMASLNDIETKLQIIIDYLHNIIHTITGILPLTLTTYTAGAASDWSISGNDNIGKNLLNIESAIQSAHMTIDSVDNSTGNIVATAESGYSYRGVNVIITNLLEVGKTYEITMTKNNATPSEQLANATLRRVDTNTIVASTGSVPFEEAGNKTFYYTHTQEHAEQGIYFSLLVTGNSTTGGTVSLSNLMIRETTTSSDFEPYQIGVGQSIENGYIIPLSVNGNTINIPIGNSPLTAGEIVSKTSTGVDIELIDGENTITTPLYNKPEMTIKYKI